MKTQRFGTAAVLAALVLIAALVPAAGARDLVPRFSFDNPYVPAGRDGQRYLDIDLFVPDGDLPLDGRPDLNLVLVVDRSGSMAASGKMEYVKRAALDIVERLREGDTFALVAFADSARTVIPAGHAGRPGRLEDAIDNLDPSGSTNLGEGLELGYREARRYLRRGAVNRVILLTDGLANRGITDPWRLESLVARVSEEGITLSAFGVGIEFNEDLLTALADAGRGSYWYIASPGMIPDLLAREFGRAGRAVYLDVTIIIRLRPGCDLDEVLGYPYRREGDRAVIRLGDLSTGSRTDVLARIRHGAIARGRFEAAQVDVSWREPGAGKEKCFSRMLSLEATADRSTLNSGADREVGKKVAVGEAGEGMARAAKLADQRRFKEAGEALKAAARVLEASPIQDADIRGKQKLMQGYADNLAGAPALAPAELNRVQKETKFEIYQMQRSGK